MKKTLLVLILCIPLLGEGQISEIRNKLLQGNLSDSEKVNLNLELSKFYWNVNIDSAEFFTKKASLLVKNLINLELRAKTFIQESVLYKYQNNETEALNKLYNAKKIIESNDLQHLKLDLLEKFAFTHSRNTDSALFYLNETIKLGEKLKNKEVVKKSKIRSLLILMHQKKHKELADIYDILIPELEKNQDFEGLMETYTYISLTFRDLNEQEKSLMYAKKAISLDPSVKNKKLRAFVFGALGSGVVSYFETFEKALPYLQKSSQLADIIRDRQLLNNNEKRMSILYYNNNDFKNSTLIIDKLLFQNNSNDPDILKMKGMLLNADKKYAEAIQYYDKAYNLYKQEKAYIQQKAILQLKLDSRMAQIGDEGLTNDFLTLDSLMAKIHDQENKNQFFDLETKYRTAEKEAEIQKKELELIKSKNRIINISALTFLILGTSAFGIGFLRNRQRRKELDFANRILELQNNLNASEISTLNNQLNPHEVKNMISSIAPELIKNAPEAYSKMIRLFNITRASLNNELIESLDIQIQQVEDYLIIQQSMSPYDWEFEINTNELPLDNLSAPRLLLKNMAENAVKHGVKNKTENGKIDIRIDILNNHILITIKDNGPGKTDSPNTFSSGIGFSTYERLFNLMNTHNKEKAQILFSRKNEWTIVEIIIPLKYHYK